MKYSCYEYEITEWIDQQLSFLPIDKESKYQIKWVYTVYGAYDDEYESDEWYDTEADAEEAAKSKIDCLENGPDDEPDYDARPYFEQSPEWWEERRKLGE